MVQALQDDIRSNAMFDALIVMVVFPQKKCGMPWASSDQADESFRKSLAELSPFTMKNGRYSSRMP
jgi:hypothetical protein